MVFYSPQTPPPKTAVEYTKYTNILCYWFYDILCGFLKVLAGTATRFWTGRTRVRVPKTSRLYLRAHPVPYSRSTCPHDIHNDHFTLVTYVFNYIRDNLTFAAARSTYLPAIRLNSQATYRQVYLCDLISHTHTHTHTGDFLNNEPNIKCNILLIHLASCFAND